MATYNFIKNTTDIDILKYEIINAGISTLDYINFNSPNQLDIFTTASLTSSEITTLNNTVDSHNPTLAINKRVKIKSVDKKTQNLINNGFSFASKQFSLSQNAQRNWLGLFTTSNAGLLTFPVEITTIDDNSHSIIDATELTNFYGTALNVYKGHLDTGRSLKISINAASDQSELDSVVDNR